MPAASLMPAAAQADSNAWVPTQSLATARFLGIAAPLAGGPILVAGGTTNLAAAALKSAEVYFPGDGYWQPVANMNAARVRAAAAALPHDRVLVAGGNSAQSSATALDTAEVYNHELNTWTLSTHTMSSPRGQWPTATPLQNGLVLVAGGEDTDGTPVDTAELYKPATNSFTPTTTMHTARSGASATLLANGNVLVAGGAGASNKPTAGAEVYDPASTTWSAVTNAMSSPRLFAGAALLPSGKVLIAGGETQSGLATTRTTDIYDPATSSFTPGPPMGGTRALFGLTPLADGRVAAVGGLNVDAIGQQAIDSSVEVYDPRSSSWSLATSLPAPAAAFTSTLLLNGQVLVAGGSEDMITGTSSAALFSPPAPGKGIPEPPGVTVSGVPRRIRLAQLLRGISVSLTPTTAVTLQISLLGAASSATVARAFNLTLVSRSFGLSAKRRTVKLVPSRKLVGAPRSAKVELVIVATDGARVSSTTTRVIAVSR
jgi:N-acetylneuraminic acid mutarotase